MRSSSQTIQIADIHRQHQPPLAFHRVRRSVSNPERAALYRTPLWLPPENQDVARPRVSGLPFTTDFLQKSDGTQAGDSKQLRSPTGLQQHGLAWGAASAKQQLAVFYTRGMSGLLLLYVRGESTTAVLRRSRAM